MTSHRKGSFKGLISIGPATVLFAIGALLGFAKVNVAAAAGSISVPPPAYRILQHQVLIDVPRNQAVFDLWFSEPPRFSEVDEFGRQRYSFQYSVRVLTVGDFTSRRSTGEPVPPLRPMLLVRGGEIHIDDKVVVREVDPLFDPTDEPESGGWGPKVAEVPFRQEGRRVRFSIPLSVFDHADGTQEHWGVGYSVHYYLNYSNFGTGLGEQLEGLAMVAGRESVADMMVKPLNPDAPIYRTQTGPLVVDLITRPAELYGNYLFAELVEVNSIRFGPNRNRPYQARLIDVNGDGYLDLRLWFTTSELGLTCLDNDLWLVGEQWDGQRRLAFVGFDTVSIALCPVP